MQLQTDNDVKKLHTAFVDAMNEFADAMLGDGRVDPKLVLAQKRQMLQSMQDQLDEANASRAQFEKAFDAEISDREQAISQLEAEIADDTKDMQRLTRAAAKAKGSAAKKPRAARARKGRRTKRTK
jgi:septal ring factor EnvC (AmiA/AmiB activator)